MRVVALQIMKYDEDQVWILRRHVISGVQIVVVSGNIFGLFYEFSKCPVEELGLFSFCRFLLRLGSRFGFGTFFMFMFQIARAAIWTDVKSAKMTVMFRLFVFLSVWPVAQFVGCSRSVFQLLFRPFESSSVSRLTGCFGRSGPDLGGARRRRSSRLLGCTWIFPR